MKSKLFTRFRKVVTAFDAYGYTARAMTHSDFVKYQRARVIAAQITSESKSKSGSMLTHEDGTRCRNRITVFRSTFFKQKHTTRYIAGVELSYGIVDIESNTLAGLVTRRRDVIRDDRAARKRLYVRRRERRSQSYGDSYGIVVTETVGGVHLEPGFYLRLRERRLASLVYKNKIPKTNENHVGLELEFTAKADRTQLGTALFQAGVAEFVTLKGDASIRIEKDNHHSHELVICVPQSMLDLIVKKVTEVLGRFEASVNKSTGFHAHIDVRNRDRNKVFSRLVAAQGLLYAMQPASRRNNTYCKRTTSRDRYTAERASRYQGVNPHSIVKHSTVEVRLHAGTVSFEKIVNWAKLLIAIADGDSVIPPRAPRKLDSFCKAFGIGSELREYIKARLDKFSNVSDDQTEAS